MESNTLPTVEEFFSYKTEEEYSRQFHNKVIVNISVDKYKEWAHEYAVLFAKWHREQAINAISYKILELKNNAEGNAEHFSLVNMETSKLCSKAMASAYQFSIDSIENAYKEGNIK